MQAAIKWGWLQRGHELALRLTPCDLWAHLRGRTLWLLGDSMMLDFYKVSWRALFCACSYPPLTAWLAPLPVRRLLLHLASLAAPAWLCHIPLIVPLPRSPAACRLPSASCTSSGPACSSATPAQTRPSRQARAAADCEQAGETRVAGMRSRDRHSVCPPASCILQRDSGQLLDAGTRPPALYTGGAAGGGVQAAAVHVRGPAGGDAHLLPAGGPGGGAALGSPAGWG